MCFESRLALTLLRNDAGTSRRSRPRRHDRRMILGLGGALAFGWLAAGHCFAAPVLKNASTDSTAEPPSIATAQATLAGGLIGRLAKAQKGQGDNIIVAPASLAA